MVVPALSLLLPLVVYGGLTAVGIDSNKAGEFVLHVYVSWGGGDVILHEYVRHGTYCRNG